MSFLEALVGLVAPPDCLVCGSEGSALCRSCSDDFIQPFGQRCWRCNRLSPGSHTCQACRHAGGPSSVWISTVYGGAAQELIRAYKFGHLRAAAKPLALLMAGTFNITVQPDSDYSIVPVPTATGRVRQRGFGHSELLAKQISYRLKLPYRPLLRRLGQSRQLGATREIRLKQLDGRFAVRSVDSVRNKNVLLVDDVLTTGGTLIAATKALRAAGAGRVDALLFAKRL
jgi:ComF family protein